MNHNRKLCHRNPKVYYSEGRNESVIARTNKGKVTMIFFVANRWLNWIFPKECSAAGFPERNRASHEIYYDGMHSKLIPLRWFICLPLHSNTASSWPRENGANVQRRTWYKVSSANILHIWIELGSENDPNGIYPTLNFLENFESCSKNYQQFCNGNPSRPKWLWGFSGTAEAES